MARPNANPVVAGLRDAEYRFLYSKLKARLFSDIRLRDMISSMTQKKIPGRVWRFE